MNRVHPTCTERPSLNKECGWKGGDRSGLAHGQELTGEREEQKHPYRKGEKRKNILDTHRPSHGRHWRRAVQVRMESHLARGVLHPGPASSCAIICVGQRGACAKLLSIQDWSGNQ